MPVIDIKTEQPEPTPTALAAGLVRAIYNPKTGAQLIREMNSLLAVADLIIVHRLLNAEDIAARLSISKHLAKKILDTEGDVQIGNKAWRMTQQAFTRCVEKHRLRTSLTL